MSALLGSPSHPLRVAVVGSGPAGFYAVEELLKQEGMKVLVDLFDRLPTPYGLVRGGVAPDHQKIKSVVKQYEKTAGRPGFRFFGNVTFGKDISLDEMLAYYHQILFTTGAESDRRLDIPGEDLPGSYPATIFVWWYNGHPDYRDLQFDFSRVESVAVVGNGNVAVDVTRVLVRSVDELAKTDITEYALTALRRSRIKDVYLLGRRGPAQAAFTNPEIRELTELRGVDLVVRPEELELDEVNREFLAREKDQTHLRNVEILAAQIAKGEGTQPRKIRARFFVSPVAILGKERVEGVRLERNRLVKDAQGNFKAQGIGVYEEISIQMIFRSIGYKGVPLPGIPFDERNGVVPNREGRVIDPATGQQVPRVYVAGWIKRGPSGVIGTNKPDAAATVQAMLEDARQGSLPVALSTGPDDLFTLLAQRGVKYVTFAGWKNIDRVEVDAGKKLGKPREKLTTLAELLAAADAARAA